MLFLISSILLCVVALIGEILFFTGEATGIQATLSIGSSVMYLISFAFLENSVDRLNFKSVFTIWPAAISLPVITITSGYWDDYLETSDWIFVAIAAIGIIGMGISEYREYV